MAYLRGEIYIWNDESNIHFWNKNGYDDWDESGWASDGETQNAGYENASGVCLTDTVVDALVMMHLAHLIAQNKVGEAIDRACGELSGNESEMLRQNAEKLKAVLGAITLKEPEPRV